MKRRPVKPACRLRLVPSPDYLMRFLAKVKVDALTGCWQWTGYKDDDGYAQVKIGGKAYWAHRASYAVFIKTIPATMEIHHRCLNTSCVNPAHLCCKTKAANVADRNRRMGRAA
jgi:hypothetical protein